MMEVLHFLPGNVNLLPDKPGIYKFFSSGDILIYVGKAKNLRKRVASYFQSIAGKTGKTKRLVSETKKIEITLVNSEFDAFLLENSLIKQYQPKYNILLKDDKTFPFINVTREPFPRVLVTRKFLEGSGQFFGPYANVRAMRNILDLIRNLYHIRTCNLNLSGKNIKAGKFKVCLEYHIGKCKGPCEGLQEADEYDDEIRHVINILKGDLKPVKDYFKNAMTEHAGNLEFEKAEISRQRLELVEKFQAKTVVVSTSITNMDVFSIISGEKSGFINFMKISNGAIIHSQTIEAKRKLDESDEELLSLWIIEFRKKYKSISGEILSNIEVRNDVGADVFVPQKGDKRKLVELSIKNALYFKKDHLQLKESRPSRKDNILMRLQDDLRLGSIPRLIECFDNSNLQGTNPVSAMVCFRNGFPSKKDYRKFNIKTVEGPDDFASMQEIVYRRYRRQIEEGHELPDLIIVDGGKGQLSSAAESLKKLGLYGKVAIIGIAKKLEEIYYPGDELPLHIDKRSPSLRLIQNLRDEAHRFAITFHRDKRQKSSLTGILDSIYGIGEATKLKLLKKYRSLQNIQNASVDELIRLIGKARAELIKSALEKKEASRS
ncbi:MAG TPA: excinuclease ABC subunit UvrC [Cyclobacteriaceae bacterium]|nr:excinuclease ABC subunit UvrC [Cyclobacteriaceae bacterium]